MRGRDPKRSRWDERQGMIAPLAAVCMVPLLGMLALGIDGGMLMARRRHVQAAADAAALAAAGSAYRDVSGGGTANYTKAQNVAQAIATTNGYSNSIQFSQPPTIGSYSGQSGYIQVVVSYNQPSFFGAIYGSSTVPVTGHAVAVAAASPYSPAAILVLGSTGSTVTLSGTTAVTAVGGSVVVDSTSSSAVTSSGSPSITTPELDLSGKISYSGTNPNKATTTKSNQTPTPDPLANLATPTTTGMTVQSNSAISLSGSTSRTLSPGVYNGAITMSGSSSLTLSPGAYYLNGLSMSGPTSISGNGVFIYNAGGGINLSGTGNISLSPMSSGAYAGLTMFQSRTNSASAAMSGGTNINLTGTFYFPDSQLTLSGSSGVAVMGAQLIAKSLTFSGTAGIKVNYSSGAVARTSMITIVQ